LDIINYTEENKDINIDFNFNGNITSIPKTIEAGTEIEYTRSFGAVDSGELILTLSGDYDYSKTILIYPELKIEVKEYSNIDSNVQNSSEDSNTEENIWSNIDNTKIEQGKPVNTNAMIVLFGFLILTIVGLVLMKPKKQGLV
jgi:hypothetical protein